MVYQNVVDDCVVNSIFQVEGVQVVNCQVYIVVGFFGWVYVVEYDCVSGCVVIEECVLWVVCDFNLLDVEEWEVFEDNVFLDDVVYDDGDWLRCGQVKVGVVQIMNIEMWCNVIIGVFCVDRWNVCSECENVSVVFGQCSEIFVGLDCYGVGDILDVFFVMICCYGDCFQRRGVVVLSKGWSSSEGEGGKVCVSLQQSFLCEFGGYYFRYILIN